ncbi:response regulator transcription factor [Bacillus sp. 1P06AnD]|uniref:response regulator transcription factor n=1 Tax=Bacillus sp. 1P06AnD TaxID=3132208 RepID=UPI0039A004FF
MWRIMVVEDQNIVREGIKMMVEQHPGMKVTSLASNGKEALEQLSSHGIDLIIMDVRMPVMDGIEAVKTIRREGYRVKILMLTTFNDDEYTLKALQEGANGFLLKTADSDKLLSAVESCLKGGLPLHEDVSARVIPRLLEMPHTEPEVSPLLTPREVDIIRCVGSGKTNKEISTELHLSIGTVKNHITVILHKLDLRDRTQLAIYAVRNHIS